MILNNNAIINSAGCSNGRCNNCAFALICNKSPYCVLNNLNNIQTDLSPVVQTVDEKLYAVTSNMSELNNNIGTVNVSYEQIVDSINNLNKVLENMKLLLNNKFESINTQLNNMLIDFENKINDTNSKIEAINTNDSVLISNSVENTENAVTPYTNQANDATILVEKKNIFGKSKWVEKKV